MSNRPITIITSATGDGPARADSWRKIAPEARELSIADALGDPAALAHGVAAIDLAADAPASAVYRLIDAIEESLSPALVLVDEADEKSSRLRSLAASAGVVVAPRDADPAFIAGALHALAQRQPAVDALLTELTTMRRFQGGLSDQIDKMHEELQLAANVQREFLPASLPETPGLEFGVLFRPCGYVSGDIYNVARLDEHTVGFFIADAVGHGVPAALMTVVLSRGLAMTEPQENAPSRIIPPSEALSRLNETMLRGQSHTRRFATAVYGLIDSRDRRVTLAGAGHPPPLRIRADGGAAPVETEGCLLGVFPDAQFDEVEFKLESDEALLLFSDGFEMAFPSGDAGARRKAPTTLYLDHFIALAAARRAFGLASAMAALARQIDEQSGSLHQVDDLTALVVAGA